VRANVATGTLEDGGLRTCSLGSEEGNEIRAGKSHTILGIAENSESAMCVGGCFVAAAAAFASRGLKMLGFWPGPFFIPERAEASEILSYLNLIL
jgi:hypothetical protein